MAFVRATCSRGGSVCKDWFDRAGLMLHWLTRNDLSVGDFTWSREGMELTMPDGTKEHEALRGEVQLNRVKHHLYEAGYEYDMSLTADAVQAIRRATTWVWFYQMSRGLFKVQYEGMGEEAIEKALKSRAQDGYAGGMPPGATMTLEAAGARVLGGEFAFLPQLETEPFFVKLEGRRGKGGGRFVYSQKEMGTEWFGSVFRDVGDEQGFRPHASGQNSVRRNAMVNAQKGAEHAGFDAAMHAKKVSQHRGDGQACREKVYEDSTATTDIGAFLMGRTPQRMEKLRSLAMTRVPELASVRKVSDVAKTDPIRVRIVDQNEQRLAVEKAMSAYAKVAKEAKAAAQRVAAQEKVQALTNELCGIVRRLEARMLEEKRQQVYADGQRALAAMPIEEFKARKQVRDLSSLTRGALLTKYTTAAAPAAAVVLRRNRQSGDAAEAPSVAHEATGARTCSREESRLRRIARRGEQHGYELDEDEQCAPLEVALAIPPLLTLLEAAAEPVEVAEVAMEPAEVAPAVVQAEAGAAHGRTAKRARQDELLVEYEASKLGRAAFAQSKSIQVGTIDGMFARARKRRAEVLARC